MILSLKAYRKALQKLYQKNPQKAFVHLIF